MRDSPPGNACAAKGALATPWQRTGRWRASNTRILEIGNYPPPVCGWAIQTKLLVEEIRRRGNVCEVLNINENRKKKSCEYIDVQNGFDYLYKLTRFALGGYRLHVHVNGQSKKGYVLALCAALAGRFAGRPVALSWRGGLQQAYFPRLDRRGLRWAFQLLFRLSDRIACNSPEIKQAIERYGIGPERVVAIPSFSVQYLDYREAMLSPQITNFLESHHPVYFCYVCFRPEYRLPLLREAMRQFRESYPTAGFIWLGFPLKEVPGACRFVCDWPKEERQSLLLLGNLPHDEFLTLLARCFAYIRTPGCDGVCSSVLESLALGVPVVASNNGRRPPTVVTYREESAADLCAKLVYVIEHYDQVKEQTKLQDIENNIVRTADWLLAQPVADTEELEQRLVHVG